MIDLSPLAQTILTVAGCLGLVLLVLLLVAGEVGRVLVKRDPSSVLAARLVLIGVGVKAAIRSKPVEVLAPPGVRALLVSLTESDRPSVDPEATPVTKVPRGEP